MKPVTPSAQWRTEGRVALQALHAPRAARVLARLLLVLIGGGGRAARRHAVAAEHRRHGAGDCLQPGGAAAERRRRRSMAASSAGMSSKARPCEKGDPLVDLSDNDPAIMQRLAEEREALRAHHRQRRSEAHPVDRGPRSRSEEYADDRRVEAADLRVRMAAERVAAADQALSAARAARVTADLNLERQQALAAQGPDVDARRRTRRTRRGAAHRRRRSRRRGAERGAARAGLAGPGAPAHRRRRRHAHRRGVGGARLGGERPGQGASRADTHRRAARPAADTERGWLPSTARSGAWSHGRAASC